MKVPPVKVTIRRPDDMHVHLRDGDMLTAVAPYTARQFARAMVMPNLTPPVLTAEDALDYKRRIMASTQHYAFEPLMTIKLTQRTTPEMIREAKAAGVVAAKLYPEGVTTNSHDGVTDFWALEPVFLAMAEVGMILSIHAETPNAFVMDREADFIARYLYPLSTHGRLNKLKVVIEHATTKAAVECVRNIANFACTITVHHLFLTLDDVVGGMLKPHYFCKPIAKTPKDQIALVEAATSGHPRIFLGTDSAPHPVAKKECSSGCAGVFTATHALELLAYVFDGAGKLDKLNAFTSENGARFYGLPLNEGEVALTFDEGKGPIIPSEVAGVVPFKANWFVPWILS